MKKFMMLLLGVFFVTLIAGSTQSVTADHLEPGPGIFKDANEVELVSYWTTESTTIQGSNYQVYLQTVIRNDDGQLINVTEITRTGAFVRHEITDYVFDTLMGEKEIITIDNIKYEKVQYTFSPTLEQRTVKTYPIFEEFPIEYVVEEDVRAELKQQDQNYYRWIIHYCATFKGHVYTCIPMFQSFAPVELVTYTDVITHQWTILRVLN